VITGPGQDSMQDLHAGAQSGAQQRRAILTRAIQAQVIPQLLQRPALRSAVSSASVDGQIKRLAGLALQSTSHEVVDFVTGLIENGFDAERLYLDLLTPTAVLLGEFWAEDFCTFADVTIGIGHLQSAMRSLRPAFFNAAEPIGPDAPRAILIPLPGEQHTFGLSMLSAFFTRAGWDAWSGCVADAAELDEMVRRDWIDLVGFSLSHDALLGEAAIHIAAIRSASRNPGVIIMVGGSPFTENALLAIDIGADGTALDGASAVARASTLMSRRSATG
ncbi:MAG: cobalamin-dependent protein, partial [Pseudomonadota bacterium]|nr:cobalamin-dependent protein [Pseudomonadota bacterium]